MRRVAMIDTQDELAAALREAGVEASQASVSRDIRALGLVKLGGQWAPRAVPEPPANPAEERIRSFVVSAATAGPHLVVIKTPPGEASGVALAFDHLDLPGVVGSVAGDDTFFVAVNGARIGAAVVRRVSELTGRPLPRGRRGNA